MYILTYRFSMFGDFKRFVPTTENVIQWTQMFQKIGYEFLPSIIAQPIVSIPFVPVLQAQSDNRLQFSSPQGNLFVRIMSERVDVERTLTETDDPIVVLSSQFDELETLITSMLEALGDVKGTRLAYFVDGMIPEGEEAAFKKVYSRNNLGIKIKDSEDYVEWKHHFNSRVSIDVNGSQEVCNSIVSMESAGLNTQNNTTGEIKVINGLHLSSDINTVAENDVARFSADDLINFCKQAQEIYFSVYEQIIEMIK